MIVDAHTHLGNFPVFNVRLDADGLVKMMDDWGISHSILFSLPNSLTLEAVERFPERLTGLVWINPYEGESCVKQIDLGIKEWGFKGIKLHPLLDSYLPDMDIVHPIMEKAKEYSVPVLFHSGHPPWSLPWHFGNLAEVFPDVPIVLGHMGHGHIVYINGTLEVAKKHDNVYLETSAMPMHTKINEAYDEIGEDRVMYGSDTPFGHPAFEVKKVEVSGLNSIGLEAVLFKNAVNLFNLDI